MASEPRRWKRHHTIVLVLVLVGVFAVAGAVEQARRDRSADVRVTFFDVGQGDAALLRDREGKDVLIDGGPDGSLLEGLAESLPWWDRTIETMVVTHLDADHYVGFFGVLKRYQVKEVWWSGAVPTTDTARRLVAEVERLGIEQHFVRAGDRIALAGGTSFTTLWPREDMRGKIVKATNDAGVVGRFDCGAESALFTADISSDVEKVLLDDPAALRSEVLKVAHHGSRYSSSEAFLDAVAPRDAVISVGAGNSYGHPTPRVLASLLARGIATHRTDREGSVSYACAGGKLRLAR